MISAAVPSRGEADPRPREALRRPRHDDGEAAGLRGPRLHLRGRPRGGRADRRVDEVGRDRPVDIAKACLDP